MLIMTYVVASMCTGLVRFDHSDCWPQEGKITHTHGKEMTMLENIAFVTFIGMQSGVASDL